MSTMEDDWYRVQARDVLGEFGLSARGDDTKNLAVEVDAKADVSRGSQPGAWVSAWVWVPDPHPGGGEN